MAFLTRANPTRNRTASSTPRQRCSANGRCWPSHNALTMTALAPDSSMCLSTALSAVIVKELARLVGRYKHPKSSGTRPGNNILKCPLATRYRHSNSWKKRQSNRRCERCVEQQLCAPRYYYFAPLQNGKYHSSGRARLRRQILACSSTSPFG